MKQVLAVIFILFIEHAFSGGGGHQYFVDVNSKSTHGSFYTTIDCGYEGRGLTIRYSASVTGFTIKKCISEKGSALYVETDLKNVNLKDLTIKNNEASVEGSIYVTKSKLNILKSDISNNISPKGSGLYIDNSNVKLDESTISCNKPGEDIYCKNCNLEYSGAKTKTSLMKIGFKSEGNSHFPDILTNGQVSACIPTVEECVVGESVKFNNNTCGDGVCTKHCENCLTCPTDCNTCEFSGAALYNYQCKYEQISDNNLYNAYPLPSLEVNGWLSNVSAPVSGILKGWFRTEEFGKFGFRITGENVGLKLKINDRVILDSFFTTRKINSTKYINISSNKLYFLTLYIISFENYERNFKLEVKKPSDEAFETFDWLMFTRNVCGDGIMDEYEENGCDNEGETWIEDENFGCSKDSCNYLNPNECFIGCYKFLTSDCPTIPPSNKFNVEDNLLSSDTLGNILYALNKEYLPGIEHMANGVDVLTGEEMSYPLFYFGFCNQSYQRVVQDSYRGKTYVVPEQLFAQPLPQCSFSISTEAYSSSYELSKAMSKSRTDTANAHAGGGAFGIKVEASFEFTKSKTVETANKISSKSSGSILLASSSCLTSHVQLAKHSFHPQFLDALATLHNEEEEEAIEKLVSIIGKYGTHYYKSASLGGRLEQITLVSTETFSKMDSSTLSEHASVSFSASVSGPFFSVGGGYGNTVDSTVSTEAQREYEKSTSRSQILTFGGASGSFGPSISYDTPSSFGDWAATVDLLPVPVDYKLGLIYDIIPEEWRTADINDPNSYKIKDLWKKASALYYQRRIDETRNSSVYSDLRNKYTLLWNIGKSPKELNLHEMWKFRVYDPSKNGTSIGSLENPYIDQIIFDQTGPIETYGPLYLRNVILIHNVTTNSSKADYLINPIKFDFYDIPIDHLNLSELNFEIYSLGSDRYNLTQTRNIQLIDYKQSAMLSIAPSNNPRRNETIWRPQKEPDFKYVTISFHLECIFSPIIPGLDQMFFKAIENATLSAHVTITGNYGSVTETIITENFPAVKSSIVVPQVFDIKLTKPIGQITSIEIKLGTTRAHYSYDYLIKPIFGQSIFDYKWNIFNVEVYQDIRLLYPYEEVDSDYHYAVLNQGNNHKFELTLREATKISVFPIQYRG